VPPLSHLPACTWDGTPQAGPRDRRERLIGVVPEALVQLLAKQVDEHGVVA